MSVNVEMLEKNMAKLTIEVDAETVDKAMNKVYLKKRTSMNVPGFRKGKVPRQVIEKMYGEGVFYEDAANELIPEAYDKAIIENNVDVVSRPDIAVIKIGKNEPFVFEATVAVKPGVELGQYKGIEIEKVDITVTDEEINAELDRAREQNSRLVPVEDRAVEDGDIVSIDFEGFVDGVAFEGGAATDFSLTIGSKSFIDNFEEQLIGVSVGSDVEVNVNFPEEYHVEELKGQPALFKVAVKEIKVKELPELDDEFADEVSEFETLEEYKADIKTNLENNKKEEAKFNKENQIIEKIVENAKMDIPDPMLQSQIDYMANDFTNKLQSQGLTMEQYFQVTGTQPQQFLDSLKPQALKNIQSRLVLEAVVNAENIEASDEEVNAEIELMASQYQMEVDKLKELIPETEMDQIKLDIRIKKVIDMLIEESVEA